MGAEDGAAERSRLAAERVARLKRRLDEAGSAPDAMSSRDNGDADGKVVADKLRELVPQGWYVLHDVHWPGRPKANLDHVLVGPGGVVVVDSKNWSGEVRVASGVLWQGRYARTQAVEGALAQCAAVASVVAPPHRRLVRPLICMAAQPDLFGVTSSDVAVAGAQRVVGAIEALPPVLDQQAVVGLYEHLGQELTHEQEPGITAFRNVRPAGPVPSAADGTPPPVPARSASRPVAPRPASPRTPSVRNASPRPAHRNNLTRGNTSKRSAASGAGSRTRSRGTTSGIQLAMLAAFVAFAVYVLPYWGP
ncbi:NERD domain-containing protein [Pseudarthrobacter phenanthrenivorans]|uniref:NERD domain-containing protein n=1 Tax=Pseudarthrobacter phenanthrenivorans TaxID=361575 RepID=A0A3B0FYJ0_PSEPS|nr:NERD domain-containing protein [Pseudarthrobacter phenanthrenivorans]RKO23387.1 NERD domain-containing protein [Pseudarthrobacter phenanthrenivorans]TPV50921.1 NERD domain-containing protein [Pseudarthrobacter phenanthrenivorans]